MKRVIPLLLAGALLQAPARAAEAPCQSLDECVSRMKAANAAKDFAAAQRFAEAAYALSPDPNLLYNLGRFHRRQDHRREALDYYQRYLDSGAPTLTQDVRAEVEAIIAKLQAELAPEPQQAPTASPPEPQQVPARPMSVQPEPRAPRPPQWLLGVGVPAAAVGLGLLSFGVVALAASGGCVDASRPCDKVYDSQGQGLATALPGGLLVGFGVALVSVDLHRRRRAHAEQPRVATAAW